tara:strand:- start:356 stop:1177 length:822 start_codon:yes stop_codon:yes gene_type:complete
LDKVITLTAEEAESIIETINDRAQEIRSLMITIASIVALVMPGMEAVGILDFTPYGQGDDEWITDDDWELGDDFECGDGSVIEASLVDDGYKNCRDGSDEPEVDDDLDGEVIRGCTDPDALNYDEDAIEDDGSCEFEEDEEYGGCTDPDAINYDPYADYDDGSCEYREGQPCDPEMYDAYWEYENESFTFYWDADLICDNEPHNLTVIWTIYENETGNWTGFQNEITYETYYQDYDYVNLTECCIGVGKYDIFATFEIHGDYSKAVDWYGIEV